MIAISLSLSMIISKQTNAIKNLAQRIALLEHAVNSATDLNSHDID